MLNPGKVAPPPAAATAVVPESVPPPGFTPIASVTVAMKAVAVLPCASCAVTWTAGAIDAPAVALDGWTESTRRVAAPAPMRSEEHTSELQSQSNLVCRLLLEKNKHTRVSIRPRLMLIKMLSVPLRRRNYLSALISDA